MPTSIPKWQKSQDGLSCWCVQGTMTIIQSIHRLSCWCVQGTMTIMQHIKLYGLCECRVNKWPLTDQLCAWWAACSSISTTASYSRPSPCRTTTCWSSCGTAGACRSSGNEGPTPPPGPPTSSPRGRSPALCRRRTAGSRAATPATLETPSPLRRNRHRLYIVSIETRYLYRTDSSHTPGTVRLSSRLAPT